MFQLWSCTWMVALWMEKPRRSILKFWDTFSWLASTKTTMKREHKCYIYLSLFLLAESFEFDLRAFKERPAIKNLAWKRQQCICLWPPERMQKQQSRNYRWGSYILLTKNPMSKSFGMFSQTTMWYNVLRQNLIYMLKTVRFLVWKHELRNS